MKTPPRFTWPIDRRVVVAGVIGLIGVMGAAALIAARPSSRGADITNGGASSEALLAPESPPRPQIADTRSEPKDVPAAVHVETKKASLPKAPVAMSTTETHTAPPSDTAVARVESPKAVSVAEPVVDLASRSPGVESTPDAAVEKVASVTITGCLERDDEGFWLKDASGTNAPRVRSWKSGFLKKSPARIELVDAAGSLRLPSFVGQRITATGTLVDREMQPHSMRRLAVSCSEP